jgi:hypothetical protein
MVLSLHHFALFNEQVNWHGDEKSVDFGYVSYIQTLKQDGKTPLPERRFGCFWDKTDIPNASTAFKVPRQIFVRHQTHRKQPKIRTMDVCREA